MATAPALRNQIEAIKKRIDAVAPTASPEDVVMLAKSIEAIGGQATVFDVMDAGVSARNEALMLIDEAKNTALTEIVKAVGITDELKAEHVALRADMAGLFDRTDLTPLVLPPGGAVLPDPARGVYALTPTDYTASSVTLPDYADGSGALKSHLLLNGGDVPVRVFDASGNAVGTIPARGASVVFAVESGGVWSWLATRSAPGSQSLIIDTPLILLDNKGVDFLELRAMNGGFLACWTKSYIPSACFLKWAAGTLVPGPISTRTYGDPGVYAHSLVKIHETRAALFWRYRDVIYYIFLDIGADGAVTFGEAKALLTGLQVATDAEFMDIVFDTGESYTASTSVPVTVELERNRQHFVRAKYTGNAFNAGNWCAPHPFTTQSANVVRVCQPTEGVAGRTWPRIDLACNVVQGNPNFNAHPTYAGIVEQLIDNQYMVGFPKCFVSREVLATGQYVGKDCRSLSDVALPGYDMHPAFLAKDGTTAQDMIWLGKYQSSADGSTKAASVPGATPLVSIDFPTMQTRCTARNTGGVSGFHLWNIHELSLVQLMMVLEFAGTDMQELVGRGHVDNTPSGVQTVDHANVLQASWRGLTGIWGNIWQMVDGIRGGKNTNKFRLDMGKGFVDTTIATCNTSLNPDKMLNISGTGWSTKHLFVGDPDTKADSLDVAAYPNTQWHYANNTSYELVAFAGGHFGNASAAGLFYLYIYYYPTNYDSNLGGRLAKW